MRTPIIITIVLIVAAGLTFDSLVLLGFLGGLVAGTWLGILVGMDFTDALRAVMYAPAEAEEQHGS